MIKIEYIEKRIAILRGEINAIDYTSSMNNLIITKFEKKRILELRSKIQILNDILSNHS